MVDCIAKYASQLCLSAKVIASRASLLHRQNTVVQSLWPQAVCHPIGSFAARTSLISSDIDVLVSVPGWGSERKSAIESAHRLKEAILQARIAKAGSCTVLENAKVPILTYLNEGGTPPVKFDVSFQGDAAVRNTAYLVERLDERPYMKDVLVLVKCWLRTKQLNEVYKGGLGSYATSLMVIGFFNHQRRVLTREEHESFIEGSRYNMFLGYLNFWTRWNYKGDIMKPDTGEVLRKPKGHRPGGYMLSIIDPADPENDVGKQSYKIIKVVGAMSNLKTRIRDAGPDLELNTLGKILAGTAREREMMAKAKISAEKNSKRMHKQIMKRMAMLERKTTKNKKHKRRLESLKQRDQEYREREPDVAAEVMRARAEVAGGTERDWITFEPTMRGGTEVGTFESLNTTTREAQVSLNAPPTSEQLEPNVPSGVSEAKNVPEPKLKTKKARKPKKTEPLSSQGKPTQINLEANQLGRMPENLRNLAGPVKPAKPAKPKNEVTPSEPVRKPPEQLDIEARRAAGTRQNAAMMAAKRVTILEKREEKKKTKKEKRLQKRLMAEAQKKLAVEACNRKKAEKELAAGRASGAATKTTRGWEKDLK